MSVQTKLLNIQTSLKAPKNQYNQFGRYKYRSCEDILEALKPLLLKERATITIKDDIVELNGKNYIKATAVLTDVDEEKSIDVSAFAREEDTKKDMDSCQITGCASSYARKYALNGLFAIDDNKDSDYPTAGTDYKKDFKEAVIDYCHEMSVEAPEVKTMLTEELNIDFSNLDKEKIKRMTQFLKEKVKARD